MNNAIVSRYADKTSQAYRALSFNQLLKQMRRGLSGIFCHRQERTSNGSQSPKCRDMAGWKMGRAWSGLVSRFSPATPRHFPAPPWLETRRGHGLLAGGNGTRQNGEGRVPILGGNAANRGHSNARSLSDPIQICRSATRGGQRYPVKAM